MPKGPQGQWRPVGDNECAALVCRIATGDSEEVFEPPAGTKAANDASRAGKARAAALTPETVTNPAERCAKLRPRQFRVSTARRSS